MHLYRVVIGIGILSIPGILGCGAEASAPGEEASVDGSLTGDELTGTAEEAMVQGQSLTRIAAGSRHNCAINALNMVECWGANESGQLGDGAFANRDSADPTVPIRTDIIAVAAGDRHSCALRSNRELYCWGNNDFNQLDVVPAGNINTPTLSWTGVSAVAAGNDHTCVIQAGPLLANRAVCWGKNDRLQAGFPASVPAAPPTLVGAIGFRVRAIAAGGNHSCAIRLGGAFDGTVFCWGANESGQLGDGGIIDSATPVQVSPAGLPRFTALDLGEKHSCAISNDGRVFCWGSNINGQLGIGDPSGSPRLTAQPLLLGGVARAISVGDNHSCVTLVDNTVRCWGADFAGQIGDNLPLRDALSPVVVGGLPPTLNARDLAAGAGHTCALLNTPPNQIRCWGDNTYSQLGNDALLPNPATTPAAVVKSFP